jgi:hypothetical protein
LFKALKYELNGSPEKALEQYRQIDVLLLENIRRFVKWRISELESEVRAGKGG